MVTSLENFKIKWKLVSSKTEVDCVTSEYECKLPSECSARKYHMTSMYISYTLFGKFLPLSDPVSQPLAEVCMDVSPLHFL